MFVLHPATFNMANINFFTFKFSQVEIKFANEPNFLFIFSFVHISIGDTQHAWAVDFAAELNKNLHYYETIHADEVVHRIVKRGAKQSNHPFNVIKEVEFKVLGRHFRIILHPQRDVLHSNFKAYSVDADGAEKVVHFGKLVSVCFIDFYLEVIPFGNSFLSKHCERLMEIIINSMK